MSEHLMNPVPEPPFTSPPTLATALRAAAADLAAQEPPRTLQAQMLAAASLLRPAAPRPGRGWARWAPAAVCAAVFAGSAFMMLRLPERAPTEDSAVRGAGFMALAPPDRWPRESGTAWLVSTELQGERLAALGLPYDPARAAEGVRAELLLHPSGEVLAVRFVPE